MDFKTQIVEAYCQSVNPDFSSRDLKARIIDGAMNGLVGVLYYAHLEESSAPDLIGPFYRIACPRHQAELIYLSHLFGRKTENGIVKQVRSKMLEDVSQNNSGCIVMGNFDKANQVYAFVILPLFAFV